MSELTKKRPPQSSSCSFVFWAGLLPLALLTLLWLFWLDLFTEALLTPFYCCDLAEALPSGSWQRSLNDFFGVSPGRYLPTLLFFLAGGLIFRYRMKQAVNKHWLPLIFFSAYLILLLASLVVTEFSWWLSNTIVGPRQGGIDAGYHRTWYGLLSHLLLWSFFFIALAKIRFPGYWRQ